MSNALLNHVFAAPHPRVAIERLLLVAIADRANKATGICCSSLADLGRRICRSPRQVRRLLFKLERDGVLLIERRHGHPSLYRLPSAAEPSCEPRTSGVRRTRDIMRPRTSDVPYPGHQMSPEPSITQRRIHRVETVESPKGAAASKIAARWRRREQPA
jgi:hypothetical protein